MLPSSKRKFQGKDFLLGNELTLNECHFSLFHISNSWRREICFTNIGFSTRRSNIDGIKTGFAFIFYLSSIWLRVHYIVFCRLGSPQHLPRKSISSFSTTHVKGVPSRNADLTRMGLSQIASATRVGEAGGPGIARPKPSSDKTTWSARRWSQGDRMPRRHILELFFYARVLGRITKKLGPDGKRCLISAIAYRLGGFAFLLFIFSFSLGHLFSRFFSLFLLLLVMG